MRSIAKSDPTDAFGAVTEQVSADAFGSIAEQVSATAFGAVTEQVSTDAFGAITTQTGSTTAFGSIAEQTSPTAAERPARTDRRTAEHCEHPRYACRKTHSATLKQGAERAENTALQHCTERCKRVLWLECHRRAVRCRCVGISAWRRRKDHRGFMVCILWSDNQS